MLILRCVFRRKAVPTGIATGLDIGLSNLSLKMITLSFYSESPTAGELLRVDGFTAELLFVEQRCANRPP